MISIDPKRLDQLEARLGVRPAYIKTLPKMKGHKVKRLAYDRKHRVIGVLRHGHAWERVN